MTKDNDINKALLSLGIPTRNSDGSLRSVYEVLNDIGCVFSKLDTEQQILLSKGLIGSLDPDDK